MHASESQPMPHMPCLLAKNIMIASFARGGVVNMYYHGSTSSPIPSVLLLLSLCVRVRRPSYAQTSS